MVVISKEHCSEIDGRLNEILSKYNLKSKTFKWNKLNSMDKVSALEEFLEYLFKLMVDNLVFIHTIIWDIQDSRHDVVGIDDIENLSRMYYKLINNFENEIKNIGIIKHYQTLKNLDICYFGIIYLYKRGIYKIKR